MKAILLNGSPRANGNTFAALTEVGEQLAREGIDYEIVQIGNGPVRDCVACGQCGPQGCVFADDGVNDFLQKAREADGFVFGTPVYYAHPTGRVLSFLDRAFYSGGSAFSGKPGAAVAVARRAGTTASLDVMNKYFGIAGMPAAGSTYWNLTHGRLPGEARQDEEGMRTMRNLARELAWMMKCFALGREQGIPLPQMERGPMTNFIR